MGSSLKGYLVFAELLIWIMSSVAIATTDNTREEVSCENKFFERGVFKGQQMNYAEKLPVWIVDGFGVDNRGLIEGINEVERREHTILISNFNHRGERFLVEIPLSSLEKVYILGCSIAEILSHKIFHRTLIFELANRGPKDGLRFFALDGEFKVSSRDPIESTINPQFFGLSYNGVFPAGKSYQMAKGFALHNYGGSLNMLSMEVLDSQVERERQNQGENFGAEIDQLSFSPQETQQLFEIMVTRFHATHDSNYERASYHTLCENCETHPLKFMNQVRPLPKASVCSAPLALLKGGFPSLKKLRKSGYISQQIPFDGNTIRSSLIN